jgi:hypothetical protein
MPRLRTIIVALCSLVITCSALAQGGPGPGPRGRPHPGEGHGPGPGPGGPGGPGQGRPWDHDRDQNNDGVPDDDRRAARPGPDGPRDGPRELGEFWDKNKQKIIDFCKENSPNRWESIERWMKRQNAGDFRPPREKLILQLKHLMELEQFDPELYKLKVAQIRVEDEEFKFARDYRRAMANGETDLAKKARDGLRQPAMKAIELRLQERQLRLARLQQRLEEEKQRLAADMTAQTKLVDAHVEEVITNPPGGPPGLRRPAPGTSSQPASAPASDAPHNPNQ